MAQFNDYLHLAQQRQRHSKRWELICAASAQAGGPAVDQLLKGLGDDR